MEVLTGSSSATQKLGEKISADLKPGSILALTGDLGSGKTTFIQGLARGLGVKKRVVSPTFVFIRQYPLNTQTTFYHVDLYRLDQALEAKGLGLEEIFDDPQAIVVIEWADKIKKMLPQKRIDIHFDYLKEDQRKIRIKKLG